MEIVLNLNNEEIEEALLTHISSTGLDMENKTTTITVTSGRKGNGLRAEIVINPVGAPACAPSTGIMRDMVEDTKEEVDQLPDATEAVGDATETPASLFGANA